MSLFEKIVSELLVEEVQIGRVNDAINNTYEVKINYQSENDNASGERIIQPVAYGLSKTGNPVIRAFQPFGDTETSVPAWKFFLLSGIQSWKPMRKNHFSEPPQFNRSGDKTMSVVYNIANFNDNAVEKATKQPKPIKASGPVKKSNIENNDVISAKNHPEVKKLEKLQKQLDNPRYISDIIKNNSFGAKSEKEDDNSHMIANSGPVSKDTFTTQTEKDIESRKQQMNKNEKVPQSVLDDWKKEQERKKEKKYGNIRTDAQRSFQ